jgi:cation/acetate symporter
VAARARARLAAGWPGTARLSEAPTPDWEGLERTHELQRLVAQRRRFVVPALVVFVVWFGGFMQLTAYARDLFDNIMRRGNMEERSEIAVARISAAAIGLVAILLALLAGKEFNIQFLVGLAFSVAASANFPALLLSVVWRRFNTAGALVGVAFGLISSITLIVLSPAVWPGPDSEGSPFPLSNPAIVSIPVGFLGCVLGTLLRRKGAAERRFDELRVRSETGMGGDTAVARTA